MTDAGPIRHTVAAQDAGPVLELVARLLGGAPEARRVLERGGVWLNRARVADDAAAAAEGDTLFVHRPPGGVYAEVEFGAERVLYEDGALIAVDKPAGVYVEATPWDAEGHLRGAVAAYLTRRSAEAEADAPTLPFGLPWPTERPFSAAELHLVHRLDRDTTGVLLLSKDPAVNPALQRAFEGGLVRKRYRCACKGEPGEDAFVVETGHGRARQGLFRVYPLEEVGRELPNGSRVKHMATRFVVERRLGGAALLRAEPLTGRTHQIRLHLAHLGHPLLGDERYGGPAEWGGAPVPRHMLHAERLELPHPLTGAPLVVVAPLPGGLWRRLGAEGA